LEAEAIGVEAEAVDEIAASTSLIQPQICWKCQLERYCSLKYSYF